jgi:hypothetical protein
MTLADELEVLVAKSKGVSAGRLCIDNLPTIIAALRASEPPEQGRAQAEAEIVALRELLFEIGNACALADKMDELPDQISGELYSRCIQAGFPRNEHKEPKP